MDEQPPPIERHAATDRFGKQALRTAHALGRALDDGDGDGEPVLFRRGGPHRDIRGLGALLDEALAEHEQQRGGSGMTTPPAPPAPQPEPPGPSPSPIDPISPPEPAPFPQPGPTDPTAPPPAPSPGPLT